MNSLEGQIRRDKECAYAESAKAKRKSVSAANALKMKVVIIQSMTIADISNWEVLSVSKYHSKKTVVDGITFDSRKEADRYCELKLLKKAGQIKDFECQPVFVLQEGYRRKDGKKILPIKYIADFKVIYPGGRIEYEDVKSPATLKKESFLIKRKLLEAKYDLILKIV